MILNGNLVVGSVNKIVFLLVFWSSLLCAQDSIFLTDALLEIAKSNKLSLIFNTNNIPERQVYLPSEGSPTTQLDHILKDTNIEYTLSGNQIYLFWRRTIYGYVEDAYSGERLVSASIYLPNTGDYTLSNEQGYFSISTIEDSVLLEASYLGYTTVAEAISEDEISQPLVLKLSADADLTEIIISDLATSPEDRNYIELNRGTDILLHQNQAVSAVGGEPDIFQAMMRQTGVNAGTDGIGGLHVRGGKNGQNLILFDGVKLYNAGHAFGAFSIINAGVVDQARLYKSGSSGAKFGRLSSILDVKTIDPNLVSFKASAQVSTIASQASFSFPLLKDHVAVMVTGRRTHIDPYIRSKTNKSKLANGNVEGETNYNFNDINVKAIAQINTENRIYLSLYRGQDRYDDDDLIDEVDIDFNEDYLDEFIFYDWKNEFASLRYNLLLGTHTIANFQLSTYQYAYRSFLEWNQIIYDSANDEEFFGRDYRDFSSGVIHQEAKFNFQTIKDNHHFTYGVTASRKKYNLGELTLEYYYEDPDPLEPFPEGEYLETELIGTYESDEYSIYFSDKFKLSNAWLVDGGLYFTYYNSILKDVVEEQQPFATYNLHGYLKGMYQYNDNYSMGASVGSYLQTEHLLTTSDNGYPNDIWVPSTADLPAERSNQIEIFTELKSKKHTLHLSTYLKSQHNILFYDTIRSLPTLTNIETDYLEEVLVTGTALGYGGEVNYAYTEKDRFAINIAYTYSRTDYQFDEINSGETFPFDYSIPHTLSIGSNVFLNKKWTLSLDWYFATGKPYTLYSSNIIFSPLDRGTEDYITSASVDDYNSQRLPNSHKLSFSFSTYWNWGRARSDLSLGVQNVYNRKNVIYQYQLEGEGLQQQLGFSLLPIVRWKVAI